MQHKFLLRFIKQEMQKQKIAFKNNEAFFRLFLVDEPWNSYRSNLSNWLSPKNNDGVIHKHVFITAINEKLGLPPDIWGASDEKQKETVIKAVAYYKSTRQQEAMLFPWLDEVSMSQEQQNFIDFAHGSVLTDIIKKVNLSSNYFQKTSTNQDFLIALLTLMYERGEYTFIYTYIFPHLLETYDNSIKSKKAHIYASLTTPMYRESFDILNSMKGESKLETMDLQTSAISNIRRDKLSDSALSKLELKELLDTFMQCYTKIYVPNEPYSYYPGINLAYMLTLVEYIFPHSLKIDNVLSVEQIYKDVQTSIRDAKASKDQIEIYYASMSEIEFKLLLGKKGMAQELEYVLEMLNPSKNLIDQTRRQMGLFFMDILKIFVENIPEELHTFQHFIDVFDDYTNMRSIK